MRWPETPQSGRIRAEMAGWGQPGQSDQLSDSQTEIKHPIRNLLQERWTPKASARSMLMLLAILIASMVEDTKTNPGLFSPDRQTIAIKARRLRRTPVSCHPWLQWAHTQQWLRLRIRFHPDPALPIVKIRSIPVSCLRMPDAELKIRLIQSEPLLVRPTASRHLLTLDSITRAHTRYPEPEAPEVRIQWPEVLWKAVRLVLTRLNLRICGSSRIIFRIKTSKCRWTM